jgi:hypothetical protein
MAAGRAVPVLPVSRPSAWRRRQVAGYAGELDGRDGWTAAVPAAGRCEQNLSPAVRAPQRIPILLVGVLAVHRWRVLLLDKAPDAGSAAYPRDDAHGFSIAVSDVMSDAIRSAHDEKRELGSARSAEDRESGRTWQFRG